jgi:phosphomannomutase
MPYDRIGLIPLDDTGAIPPRARTQRLAEMVGEMPEPLEISYSLPEPETLDYDFLTFTQNIVGDQLPGKGIRVALDPAGGTGAGIVSRLMNDLGCDVEAINDRQMNYAPRRMEPRVDSVNELVDLVQDTGADFGAAYDSDCDRVLFVDETGEPLSEDLAAVIFAEYLYALQGGNIVTPVNSSGLIKKIWQGQVIDCIIGPPEISQAARENNAVFAYEESGKYFFPPRVMWADGLIATAFMARILASSRKSLSTIVSEFPRHVQIKRNIKGTWQQMADLLVKVKEGFHPRNAVLNDIDGLKYVFDDGSWLLIRLSGTEPLMRIYVDSPSPTRARELSELGMNTVKRLMEE